MCPFYQPSTQNVELRTFFAHMARTHNWQFNENDLKGFTGSLDAVIAELYDQRLKKYVSFYDINIVSTLTTH